MCPVSHANEIEVEGHNHNRVLRFTTVTSHLTNVLSLLAPDLIQESQQMRGNLLQGSSKPCPFFMHSPLLSIHFYHTQSFFPAPQIQCSFFTIHSFHSWLSSQPHTSHIRSYYSLQELLLLHSVHVSKPPQQTLLCLTNQLQYNTSSLSHHLISHSVHTHYSTNTLKTPHLHYI